MTSLQLKGIQFISVCSHYLYRVNIACYHPNPQVIKRIGQVSDTQFLFTAGTNFNIKSSTLVPNVDDIYCCKISSDQRYSIPYLLRPCTALRSQIEGTVTIPFAAMHCCKIPSYQSHSKSCPLRPSATKVLFAEGFWWRRPIQLCIGFSVCSFMQLHD